MSYFVWITGIVLGLVWLSRVLDAARGVPKIADISEPDWDRRPTEPHRLAIIVPALNEEDSIEPALRRLLALDCDDYQVIAVNDRSTDQTGEIMDQVAAESAGRLKVVHINELPSGWLGKVHAMWTAAQQAEDCDWLLFTDADVMFRPDCLRRAVAYAERECADHLVLFPHLTMKRIGEKMMIGFFQLLFVFGHRPWKVSDPRAKDHMGVGAFNLVRQSAYRAIGTYKTLRFEVVDDMKLGKVIKNAGLRQRVAFGDNLIEIRWARGALGVVGNLTKNFFAVVSFQTWRALLSCVAMAILNLAPFLGVAFSPEWSRIPYVVAAGCIFLLYAGISGRVEIAPWYFFLHPVSTVLFIYIMLRSTFVTLWNGGVEWRGTRYPLKQLRKGLV